MAPSGAARSSAAAMRAAAQRPGVVLGRSALECGEMIQRVTSCASDGRSAPHGTPGDPAHVAGHAGLVQAGVARRRRRARRHPTPGATPTPGAPTPTLPAAAGLVDAGVPDPDARAPTPRVTPGPGLPTPTPGSTAAAVPARPMISGAQRERAGTLPKFVLHRSSPLRNRVASIAATAPRRPGCCPGRPRGSRRRRSSGTRRRPWSPACSRRAGH